ncbi:MAG: phosphoribosylamine--glycine ligase [Caulobacteraceae bacterium]
MNVLVVGSGGREHALAWRIATSPQVNRLVAAPGNAGIAALCEQRTIAATDAPALVGLAREIGADLVVIGPDAAIEAGLADAMKAAGIPCFGPSAAAGRLESSKAFAKRFAERHGIPAAKFGVFSESAPARAFLAGRPPPYVVKADGLAAGKGVIIAPTLAEAEDAVAQALGGRFGAAGSKVVIEEYLSGEIGSVFALSDGRSSMIFGAAQDHKRALDGEKGPNTGGMGSYSPAPALTAEVIEVVRTSLIEPALRGIAEEGAPYRGVLFCELMVTDEGPKLIEFNARFGDPECQVLMLRLADDVVPYLAAAASGELHRMSAPRWRQETAICVVLAARGYPDNPSQGSVIHGAEADFGPDVMVFHAGTTRRADGELIASGGRVLNVCAVGRTLAEARSRAYDAIAQIDWPEGYHRRDIGWRALPMDSSQEH